MYKGYRVIYLYHRKSRVLTAQVLGLSRIHGILCYRVLFDDGAIVTRQAKSFKHYEVSNGCNHNRKCSSGFIPYR